MAVAKAGTVAIVGADVVALVGAAGVAEVVGAVGVTPKFRIEAEVVVAAGVGAIKDTWGA